MQMKIVVDTPEDYKKWLPKSKPLSFGKAATEEKKVLQLEKILLLLK
jgi:heme/copper-type cytochrome/quinol oxidase subunit 2